MAQVHFIEVRKKDGEWLLIRSDSIDAIERCGDGLDFHTPSGIFTGVGATRQTLNDDMRSAQIVLVALNKGTGAPPPVNEPAAAPAEPIKAPVTRGPPPTKGLPVHVDLGEQEAPSTAIPSDTAPRTRRKASA